MSEQPTQATSGQTTDTSVDGLVPPGAEDYQHDVLEETGDPIFQVAKLASFLDERFPGERSRSNRQAPETPADTAIRLLQSLSASAPLSALERCAEAYCNKPSDHEDEHGWVHNG